MRRGGVEGGEGPGEGVAAGFFLLVYVGMSGRGGCIYTRYTRNESDNIVNSART